MLADRCSPLMCLPVTSEVSSLIGGQTISVFAGESVTQLLAEGGAWSGKSRAQRLELGRTVGACVLSALDVVD
jgi:hypothetical protein